MTKNELNDLESIPKLNPVDLEKKLFELVEANVDFLHRIKFVKINQDIPLMKAQMVVMNSGSYEDSKYRKHDWYADREKALNKTNRKNTD